MKRACGIISVISICVIVLCVAATVADKTGLFQAFLQGNMDGNGNSVTNAMLVSATNLTASSNSSGLFFTVTGTTNQVVFGATNTAPGNTTTPATWISVQVGGSNNAYRLPVYQ